MVLFGRVISPSLNCYLTHNKIALKCVIRWLLAYFQISQCVHLPQFPNLFLTPQKELCTRRETLHVSSPLQALAPTNLGSRPRVCLPWTRPIRRTKSRGASSPWLGPLGTVFPSCPSAVAPISTLFPFLPLSTPRIGRHPTFAYPFVSSQAFSLTL